MTRLTTIRSRIRERRKRERSDAERYAQARASHATSVGAQNRRRAQRAVEEIAARVAARWPDPRDQRRALERWSGVLRASDPGVAGALLEVPVKVRAA